MKISTFLKIISENLNAIFSKKKKKIVNEEKNKIRNNSKPKDETGPRISINNTLYLNTSSNFQSVNIENTNQSFDMQNDIDFLSKKIGNISFINNNKNSNNSNNFNNNNKQNQMEMEDIFMKMVVEEEGDQKKPTFSLNTENILNENTNYSTNKLNTSFEKNRKKPSISIYNQSKIEEPYKKKEETSKANTSFQHNSSFVNESKLDKTYNNVICCTHEDELKKAKQKLDHLMKKMKLITEENKVLIIS